MLLEEFKGGMLSTFEMNDLGVLHYFLGLGIHQGTNGIFIFQKKYAEGLIKRFNMYQCNKTLTLMNEKLHMDDGSGDADTQLQKVNWRSNLSGPY